MKKIYVIPMIEVTASDYQYSILGISGEDPNGNTIPHEGDDPGNIDPGANSYSLWEEESHSVWN